MSNTSEPMKLHPVVEQHPDDVLTLAMVAKELHCSKPHVCAAIYGKLDNCSPLPALSFGRRLLVRRETLDRWKRENERVIIPGSRGVDASERKIN